MVSFPLSTNVITEGWTEFRNHVGFFASLEPSAVSVNSAVRSEVLSSNRCGEEGLVEWSGLLI